MGINKAAWGCLMEDEKTALSLQHGMQKSTWEAGQVMSRSHYKYLEISQRAAHFLKKYTEHINLMGCVVPEDLIKGKSLVIPYLQQCLELRKKPMAAIEAIQERLGYKVIKSELNQSLIKTIAEWGKSEDAIEATMFNFVKDFDRWNNFRILPREIQEPSAFKRRTKNIYKRHIKLLNSIPELGLNKLIEIYQAKDKHYGNVLYMPVIFKKEPMIIKVRSIKPAIETITSISYYLFTKKEDAQVYVEIVYEYSTKSEKDCRDGLMFWPKYRDIIKKAYNYNEIMNITPSRKYLELALKKVEFF